MSTTETVQPGPGFKNPDEAGKGPREKILYIPCINTAEGKPDYISVVDVDPQSSKYLEVVSRLKLPVQKIKDEVHHSGWNACSSCHEDSHVKRDKLIFPCLNSDRIYIIDLSKEDQPKLHKTIEPEELHKLGLSTPHTSHCLKNGEVMISTMGNGPDGDAKGSFLILDAKDDFKIKGTWSDDTTPYGYDFWYQPKFDVMISSQWGAPKEFKKGLNPANLEGNYGHSLNVWSWKNKKLVNTIDLGETEGWMPLETRFLHDPTQPHAFVGCALSSTVFHIHQDKDQCNWIAEKVITVKPKTVKNWWVGLTEMPGVITDIIISMNDQYLYISNWVHGDIRQYDITTPSKPKLTGQVFIGGSIVKGGAVEVVKDEELSEQPDALVVLDTKIVGGPQMLQLSLDGKRLYVTTSLFSNWDKQFYPELVEKGACLLQIDVDVCKGGMKVNPKFLVNFGKEPDGPVLAHEIRYPGGDCTSDIFLSNCH